eukprot:924163_1
MEAFQQKVSRGTSIKNCQEYTTRSVKVMDPTRSASRVIKTGPEDTEYNTSHQQYRKFNVTPAPISRPPSSYGNKGTRLQKIKPPVQKKRLKWNDRFHIESEEQKQLQPTPSPPIYKPHKQRKKPHNTYSDMHAHTLSEKKERKKAKRASNIPPRDPLTGRRQWGKRNKKRAKWSMMKKNSTHRSRAKWNKTEDSNPLSLSQSRVLPLSPKTTPQSVHRSTTKIKQCVNKPVSEEKQQPKDDDEQNNIHFSKHQKHEIKELFSECLKNVIQKKDKPKQQLQIEMKEESFLSEEQHDTPKSVENTDHTNIKQTYIANSNFNNGKIRSKRATKRLLPITIRNKSVSEQRKRYLEPLDKVADIILDDLIDQVAGELDVFCCQVVDMLVQNETNMP